jgi:hypothetical protein
MRSELGDKIRLKHILDAIGEVEKYLSEQILKFLVKIQ